MSNRAGTASELATGAGTLVRAPAASDEHPPLEQFTAQAPGHARAARRRRPLAGQPDPR